MASAKDYILQKLNERQQAGNFRTLKPESSMIDFCSNDYLGFARSEAVRKQIELEIEAQKHLNGATGSRLISGNLAYTETLEKQLAIQFKAETGLLFNSGYDANVGLLSSLPQRGDTIITDELIHASIIDGARLSHANRYSFKHNDLAALEAKLRNAKGICYVVVESVYSMDGDKPPLADMLALTQKYNANLIVDEAHATGLYGTGIVTQLGLQDGIFARVVTFGKAMGCHGAIVLGSDVLRQYLINFARSFIYTTAAPFHQLAAIKIATEALVNADDEIEKLRAGINYFKEQINLPADSKYEIIDSDSSIQCILLKSNEKANEIAIHLQSNNLDVRAIKSPTVPTGSERIRICLHAYNTKEEIGLLTANINNLLNA